MFDFLKRNKPKSDPESDASDLEKQSSQQENAGADVPTSGSTTAPISQANPEPEQKPKFFQRLKQGLQKTRKQFSQNVANIVLGKKIIDANLLADIEDLLLVSDLGMDATQQVIRELTERISRKQLDDAAALLRALQEQLVLILQPCTKPLVIPAHGTPFVILVVGVNGVGKTTTIGKLANYYQQQGKKVLLAAGDTFRAAATEQLQVWGERNNLPVISQQAGADSASVIFDALQAAKARGIDIVLADTAGRLHTKTNLMEELKKIRRVLTKIDPNAPQEVLLVLDAGNGQNALSQAKQFYNAMGVTGIALTKLDGTAKGGIIFAIAKALSIPIRFIGVGENIDDLRPFNAEEFVSALFTEEKNVSS